ncbi:MAG TPA: hypothetical protein PLP83_05235 [Candidatus Aminicenantes bacterium]|nr:hypothetical protein [Candidatus Aminicenantes bacterium]
MSKTARTLAPLLLAGLALVAAACDSEWHGWVEPEELKVKVLSGPLFVRTARGDYVDGCLAEYRKDLRPTLMFMALELPRYAVDDRLVVTGRFAADTVAMPSGAPGRDRVPVFKVEQARPDIPKAPDIPQIK